MKHCPLMDKDCSENDCKWWTAIETIDTNCIVFEILGELRKIKTRLVLLDEVICRLIKST